MRLAYLFSRYPIVSQTFCDTEILALERLGVELELHSIYPPPTSFRHGHAARIRAEIFYAPPQPVLKGLEQQAKAAGRWPAAYIAEHDRRYGVEYKAALRARNALYFADLFHARGIRYFHVHFANRAAQTALFIKHLAGIPFSVSTHGQDFMSDLGSDELLREICGEAEFVANETEFSKELIARVCPASAGKLARVFNGMDLTNFPEPPPSAPTPRPRIVSVGRLIEFKGFHHLIGAAAKLRQQGLDFACEIIGEGPWRARLQAAIDAAGLGGWVELTGALPQEEVFRRLRGSDLFALPCIVDQKQTSDVFPTVILEAMASGKPVVSTRLAGVPEQIIDGETGLLVPPGDEAALAGALARLVQSPALRAQYGQAARQRLVQEFAVEQTVAPLHALFQRHVPDSPAPAPTSASAAVLLHTWPATPAAAGELRQLLAEGAWKAYVAEAAEPGGPENLALLPRLHFLPDGMVIEGEWQQQRELARRLEVWRQELGQKLSSETFLQEARRALFLSRWVQRDGVRHLHALSSRELLCGWLLRKLCGITLSASLEEHPRWLADSIIVRLATECCALRVAGAALRDALEPEFQRTNRLLLQFQPGRALEPQWLAALQKLSALLA